MSGPNQAPNRHARRRAAKPRIDISRPLSEQPCLWRLADAEAYLDVSKRTLNSWERKGLLRVVRPCGGLPYIERDEIARILREGGAP